MAETEKPRAAAPEEGGGKRKPVHTKTLGILVGAFLLEGLAITAVFLWAGSPGKVQAKGEAVTLAAENEKVVEVLIIEDRFPNNLSGRAFIYETEIYIHTRKKHEDMIKKKLEGMQAQIKGDIAEIFRASEPSYLSETSLGTLKRRIRAKLDEHLDRDADGNEYVEKVLIPKCTQFRTDL